MANKSVDKIMEYSNQDFDSILVSMIQSIPYMTPEYTDFSDSDFGMVLIELMSKAFDILSWKIDVAVNESLPFNAVSRRAVFKHCKWLGYDPKQNEAATTTFEFTVINDGNSFTIPKGTKISSEADSEGVSIIFECSESVLANPGVTPIGGEYTVQVKGVQGITVEEVLGVSDGKPNQTFKLTKLPYIEGSLSLMAIYKDAQGNDVYVPYEEAESHISMIDSDKAFVLSFDYNGIGSITFGDGVNGYIPEVSSSIRANYRIGGGTIGNVSVNYVNILMSTLVGKIAGVKNIAVGVGGREQESVDEIKNNAPHYRITGGRLVTSKDFIDFATKGSSYRSIIGGAQIASHPTIIDKYNYYVAPYDRTALTLTSEVKQGLEAELLERALLGLTFNVVDPIYVNIVMVVDVTLTSATYIPAQGVMTSAMVEELVGYVNGKTFGEEVSISDLYSLLLGIDTTAIKKINIKSLYEKLGVVGLSDISPAITEIVNFEDVDVDIVINYL